MLMEGLKVEIKIYGPRLRKLDKRMKHKYKDLRGKFEKAMEEYQKVKDELNEVKVGRRVRRDNRFAIR